MKTCTKCKRDKPDTEFNKNRARKDGLNNICRECSRARSKQYYAEHTERHKRATRKQKAEYIKAAKEYVLRVKQVGCAHCPEDEPVCLDFHHVGRKDGNISRMVNNGCSLTVLKREIKKCVVVCSNCHRKLHAGLLDV